MTIKKAEKIVSTINTEKKDQFRKWLVNNKIDRSFIFEYQNAIDELLTRRFGLSICFFGCLCFAMISLIMGIFNINLIFTSISKYIFSSICIGFSFFDLYFILKANSELKNKYKKLFENSNLSKKEIEALVLTGELYNITAGLDLNFDPVPFAEFSNKTKTASDKKLNLINTLRSQLEKIADGKKQSSIPIKKLQSNNENQFPAIINDDDIYKIQ